MADLSANHVEKVALLCGYAVERVRQDYGLDLAIFTFDEHGFRESGVVWMQLKATDHLKPSRTAKAVLVRLERKDVLAWIAEAYPVILVLYDATGDRAYWLSIQKYFADRDRFAKLSGATITVGIPTANLLNDNAMRDFAREKAGTLAPKETKHGKNGHHI